MIQKQTFDFLLDLVEHNNREWFMDNKARHDQARENVIDFAAALIKEFSRIDPNVDLKTDPKKCVMRIYRDIRFSLDKTPYKNHFGIGKLTAGKPASITGYYFHLQPGASFIGGGYWQPEPEHLKAIRQEIDYNGDALKQIVDNARFRELFGDFRKQEQLKNVPKEYNADNENIDLLKLKSFTAIHHLSDGDLLKEDGPKKVSAIAAHIYPLNVFLNNAIT